MWTKKTSTEKNVAKKASNQVFTTYHELDLIKDVRLELKVAKEKALHKKEMAAMIEDGFQARKKQHANEVALKIADLQAEIAKLQTSEYTEP